MTTREDEMAERLQRTELRYTGASNIFTGDEGRDQKPETVLVNPDGPEAAAMITALSSERDLLVETLGAIRKLAMDDHWGTPKVCCEIISAIDAALTGVTGG